MQKIVILTLAVAVTGVFAMAQWTRDPGGRGGRGGFGGGRDGRAGVPDWENDAELPQDKFTFARVQYSGYGRGFGGWRVDYPDADLNFSYRLEQLTAIKADPDGTVVDFTDDLLMEHPFVYITDPRSISLGEDEVKGFREYLLNGGFFMADDFWSEPEWESFYREMKRVLPDVEPVDLPVEHPLFNHVFPLNEKPQVPSEDWYVNRFATAQQALDAGVTWETKRYETLPPLPHYYAYFDKKGRMMGIACHNTDVGDGWEEEGATPWYFEHFSEPKSYPMGINILVYAMTH
ncbi:MAG: DUF4159 domain-containing protein [Verrucomicrobiota bacterium]|nr:DUF4159 domain-containing protein [Verrucomicrobiota bacterium]